MKRGEMHFLFFYDLLAAFWAGRHDRGVSELVGSFVAKYPPKPSHLDMLHTIFSVFCNVFLLSQPPTSL